MKAAFGIVLAVIAALVLLWVAIPPGHAATIQPITPPDTPAMPWTGDTTLRVDVNLLDATPRYVTLQFHDDGTRQTQVNVIGADDGIIKDVQLLANFSEPKYAVWQLQGPITFEIIRLAGNDARITGIFFDTTDPLPLCVKQQVIGNPPVCKCLGKPIGKPARCK